MTTALQDNNLITQIRDNVEQLNLQIAGFRREVTEFRTDIELLRADMDRRFDRLESLPEPIAKPPTAPAYSTPTRRR